ncbi:MAG TPA: ATP-binding protein [Thermoleophilaceae bacterium]|jgi:anti-sigma regulatory factor (Ser/Thr protein kinase)
MARGAGGRADFEVAGGRNAPATARRQLVARVGDRLDATALYDASLLLSELVTNAVRHGGAGEGERIEVQVSLRRDRIHIGVTDPGRGFERPAAPRARPGGHGGNGLPLLQALAADWNVERGKRTRVWFEMALHRAA